MSLRHRLLSGMKGIAGEIPLRLALWDGETIDLGSDPSVVLTVRSPAVARLFLTGRLDRLGDAYVAGQLSVDGKIEDVIGVGIRLAESLGGFPKAGRLLKPFALLRFRHSAANDAEAIRYHYDAPATFYRPWLDETMTYSCAYFPTGTEDIDAAQRAKIDHICRKLRLQPGERLIDIGCGWGGLLMRAAEKYGVLGIGLTNSRAQSDWVRAEIDRRGLGDRLEIRHQDYRDIAESEEFDKVVSVGMYEHVGLANLGRYFGIVARLLKPGGTLLNHGIVTTDAEGRPQGPPGGEFIGRHVFPGGELSNLAFTLRQVALSGLEAVDIEDLRPHYARTLQLWVRRLEARSAEVIEAGGIERYRIWRVYLAGMAFAFDRGWLSVAQIVACKPAGGRPASRPWSRAYQYRDEGPAALTSPLDWTRRDRTEQ